MQHALIKRPRIRTKYWVSVKAQALQRSRKPTMDSRRSIIRTPIKTHLQRKDLPTPKPPMNFYKTPRRRKRGINMVLPPSTRVELVSIPAQVGIILSQAQVREVRSEAVDSVVALGVAFQVISTSTTSSVHSQVRQGVDEDNDPHRLVVTR